MKVGIEDIMRKKVGFGRRRLEVMLKQFR